MDHRVDDCVLIDLWIAASALRHVVPLITRNQREFAGLPGLEIVGYP